MLVADAMMDAGQARFQVGEDEMDDLGHLRIAAFGHGEMLVATLAEAGVAGPVIRGN
jgi:hypothetical protein